MSKFIDLRYVNGKGNSAPVDPADPQNPYFGHAEPGRSVRSFDMCRLEWHDAEGRPRHAMFKSMVIAAVDPRSDLLVVVVYLSDPQYKVPRNAIVLNSDASVNHQVTPPPFVDRIDDAANGKPANRQAPVEGINDVLLDNGRIVMGLKFDYEWNERRYYDPATRQWQERHYIFRL